jgi:hypothetical protein
MGVGEALVRASSGNTALALLLLVGTNALGIGTMPPWLKLLLSQTEGLNVSVDALKLFYKLLVTVLAPALVGKVSPAAAVPIAGGASGGSGAMQRRQLLLRQLPACIQPLAKALPAACCSWPPAPHPPPMPPLPPLLQAARELVPPIGRFGTRFKQELGMFSTVQLALIIWQTLSAAQVSALGWRGAGRGAGTRAGGQEEARANMDVHWQSPALFPIDTFLTPTLCVPSLPPLLMRLAPTTSRTCWCIRSS